MYTRGVPGPDPGVLMELVNLTAEQFSLVYNMLSLAIASMIASFAFFVMARQQVAARFRPALVMSALVVGIAGYHYWRIFESWGHAYNLETIDGVATYVASGEPFNDAYRYVDWLLTVPLLVAELVAVMTLAKGKRGPMMAKLAIASALMIALGYPGEIAPATDIASKVGWGVASSVPFCYILYVLWVELNQAAKTESGEVQVLLRNIRLLLLGTWGFYPISYILSFVVGTSAWGIVGVQVGYSISDIAAKCGYGIMIYAIARAKMAAEDGIEDAHAAPAK